MKRAVVSLSGGLDSTILTYHLVDLLGAANVFAVSIDYGQRHSIELELAKRTCRKLGVEHKIIKADFLYDIVKGTSAMVKNDLKHDHKEFGPNTYVPFRNAMFAMIMASYAEAKKADAIALGLNLDQPDKVTKYRYWDITPDFYQAIQNLMDLNTDHPLTFYTPFVTKTKADEIKLGLTLKVPFEEAFSCYNPIVSQRDVNPRLDGSGNRTEYDTVYKYVPCRECAACEERMKAFDQVGIFDPVEPGVEGDPR